MLTHDTGRTHFRCRGACNRLAHWVTAARSITGQYDLARTAGCAGRNDACTVKLYPRVTLASPEGWPTRPGEDSMPSNSHDGSRVKGCLLNRIASRAKSACVLFTRSIRDRSQYAGIAALRFPEASVDQRSNECCYLDATRSKAPISTADPCGRDTPRLSRLPAVRGESVPASVNTSNIRCSAGSPSSSARKSLARKMPV